LDVNLTGAISTIVASLPYVADGGSLLVNRSSMAIRPREERLAYVAAKAGLHAVARALAAGGCSASNQSERDRAGPHRHPHGSAHPGPHRERASLGATRRAGSCPGGRRLGDISPLRRCETPDRRRRERGRRTHRRMTDHPLPRVGGHGHSCHEELFRPGFAPGCIAWIRLEVPVTVDVLERRRRAGDRPVEPAGDPGSTFKPSVA
jgi:Enoyl-(Acyl carrier protein) reductase